jgi:hypothetical protein
MEILSAAFDRRVGLLGAHPLFSPTISDLTGLIVAAVDPNDGRSTSPWRHWFLEQLADLRIIVTPVSAEDHDDAMAFVQSLTHFALLTFAYTFVRLDRDPADLLALRTPVFEPLLYLAARVANLARTNPETYRSIQTFSARPDARRAFLESAEELLAAIECAAPSGADALAQPDRLAETFHRYGAPWSPDGKDRRDRPRREHFLDMGAGLVDNLNRLRQEIVSSAGQARAVEERRSGQPSRVVVGVVDLDLLDPGKQDVATRIRLRRVNLGLGSVAGGLGGEAKTAGDAGQDEIIPLARARLLSDGELFDWLHRTGQLVERRTISLIVPSWFDRDVLCRLIGARQVTGEETSIWDAELQVVDGAEIETDGEREVLLTLAVVVHPGAVVARRRTAQDTGDAPFRERLAQLDEMLSVARGEEVDADSARRDLARRTKDRLKHERKALVDRRTAEVDREVRRAVRLLVQRRCDEAVTWLLAHGCRQSKRAG